MFAQGDGPLSNSMRAVCEREDGTILVALTGGVNVIDGDRIVASYGEADGIVPCEMAHALRRACASPVTLLTVPGANHGISWYVDLPAYQGALERFMEENMG